MLEDKPSNISYYDWLKDTDVVGWLKPFWSHDNWTLRVDGKFQHIHHCVAIDTPWIHTNTDWRLSCNVWHQMIFECVAAKQPPDKMFVPSRCHECWKTVVKPQTLRQLFALEKLQQRLDRPSKAGVERRSYVPELYGGYFYAVGFREGCERYREVRAAVNEDKLLGSDVPVVLKRACTEFEMAAGPSDKWQIYPGQMRIEQLIERHVVRDDWEREQPEILKNHIRKKWIEFAFCHKDPTYADFTDGKSLGLTTVTYQEYAEAPDFPNNIISKPLTPSALPDKVGADASEEKEE